MAIITTDNKHYNDIANAIREKTGTETTYTPEEMKSGIAEVYDAGIENTLIPIRESLINKGEELSETAGVEEITGCIEGLNFWSDFTDFSHLFEKNIRKSNVPNIRYKDTHNATRFDYMFNESTELNAVPLFDTSKGTHFSYMFYNCTKLTEIPPIDTSNGTIFYSMFSYCTNITTIPLIDTSKGTAFNNMFFKCINITTIPSLDTSNGKSFLGMFSYCTKLTEIPPIDTSKGTGFYNMFGNCTNITTIPPIDTSKGTEFNNMFYNCTKLITVPPLDTSNSTTYNNMFVNCTSLQNITFVGTINVNGLNLSSSTKLTHDSLMSIVNALADKSGDTSTTWKVSIGSTNLAKLTAEEIKIAEDKGWVIV